MTLNKIKIFIILSIFLLSFSNSYAKVILSSQEASKLTFAALTATPEQWKKWSHKTIIISKKNKNKYKIKLASYKHHSKKHNFHHHYRT